MNKILVILVGEDNTAKIDAGGIELQTVAGVREAISMATFAESYLTEVLVNLRAKELAEEHAKPEDLPAGSSDTE